MNPTLQVLLEAASRVAGVSEPDIRLGSDARALDGLGAFVWMAQAATPATIEALAMFVGRPRATCAEALAALEQQLDEPLRDLLIEECFAARAILEIRRQRGRVAEPMEPEQIARRILGGRASAITVGEAHYRQLASAYLSHEAARAEAVAENEELAMALKSAHRALDESRKALAAYPRRQLEVLATAAQLLAASRNSPGERDARTRFQAAVDALLASARAGSLIPPAPIHIQKEPA